MVAQPRQQVANWFAVSGLPSQERGELRLATGALEVDNQLPRDRGGGLVSVVLSDQCQRQVNTSGDTGGGPDIPVVHVDRIRVDGDSDVGVVEQAALCPVGRRSTALQQTDVTCALDRGAHERRSYAAATGSGIASAGLLRKAKYAHTVLTTLQTRATTPLAISA